ncbi:thermonuclease family protein [Rhodobacteraceae bacterium]|nr:thermonuclease family protein [Paracoccaceae bacterium]|tara:strand:- start:3176 stop:3727 length:552 start_codon:yes stop_codon:yes gene_type:complete
MPNEAYNTTNLQKLLSLAFSISVMIVFILSSNATVQASDTEIYGIPEVIDADVLKFGQERVILWGIDAPERPQKCRMNGKVWGCHEVAKRHMQLLAGRGEVTCVVKGDPDPLGRHFGVCSSGGQDLNAEMVKAGMALALQEQTEFYFSQMVDAITAGVGLWQVGVTFEEPWVFRRRESPGGLR